VESQNTENAEIQLADQPRSERRLARGLEDISYLFLSQADETEKKTDRNAPSEQAHPQPPPTTTPVFLRPAPAIDRDLLASQLSKNAAILEEGLRTIDKMVPCDPFGCIDVLLLDGQDQLVIMDIDAAPNDGALLRGLGHFDWLTRNAPILRRMYQGRAVNFSAQPRLLLIAPSFSLLLKCAVQRNVSPKINCFEYHTIALPGGLGVFFESV
jgi:hypothetical protein